MRSKDYTAPTFVFGEHPNGTVDINCGLNEVLTRISRKQAQMIIDLMNERAYAIEFLLDRADPDTRDDFYDLIQTHEAHQKVFGGQ